MEIRKDALVSLVEKKAVEFGKDKKEQAYEAAGAQVMRLHENKKANKVGGVDFRSVPMRTVVEACLEQAELDVGVISSEDISKISEAVGSSAFPNITKYLVHSEVIPAFEREEARLAPLFTELTASRTDVERIAGFTTPEGFRLTAQNEPTKRTKIEEKYAEIQIDKFTNSIDLTKEAIYNDRLGMLISKARDIGQASGIQFEEMLMQTIEIRERTILEGRESGGAEAAKFDGTIVTQNNFYSDDHSALAFMGRQVNDNNQTAVLSITGLDSAMNLFSSMKDESGFKIAVRPNVLLVSTNKFMSAWEIINSVSRPDTANDAANIFGPSGPRRFEVLDTTFLNDNNDWYLGDFAKQVVVLYWQRPNITTAAKGHPDLFEKDIVMAWKYSAGFGMGHRDYRYIVRSNVA